MLPMMTRLSFLSICGLILIFLPLTLGTSPAADSSRGRRRLPDCPANRTKPFWKKPPCEPRYVHPTCTGNGISKKIQLYSRTSALFLQINTTLVDARGEKGSQYARLVLEPNYFNRIKIRGENTKRYLCMNKKGKLVTRTKKQLLAAVERCQQCEFTEEYSDGYYQYRSFKYPQWFIGFSRKGKPRNGRKSDKQPRHKYRQFMRYDRSGMLPGTSNERRKRKHRCGRNHKKRNLARVNAGTNVKKSRKCGHRQGRKKL